jgi:hypothetical protein
MMLQWYINNSDTAMPTKKADKLAQYYQICMQGEPTTPILLLLPLPPLPTLPQPTLTTASDSDLLLLADAMMTYLEHRCIDNKSGLGDSLLLCNKQLGSDDSMLKADLTLNEDENSSIVDNNELMPMEV